MVIRDQICSFTGHRPEKLPWGKQEDDQRCLALKGRLAQAVEQHYRQGCFYFLCGMARGADLYFAEAVLALKEACPEVVLHAVRPCETQTFRWSRADRERYQNILNRCDHESLLQHHYDPGCMGRRNRFLVDHSAYLIAIYDGSLTGGTAQTVRYARRSGLTVTILDLE